MGHQAGWHDAPSREQTHVELNGVEINSNNNIL